MGRKTTITVAEQAKEFGLTNFFEYIYQDTPGFVYIAAKRPGNQHNFSQYFFEWPAQKSDLVTFVTTKRADWEVYYAPAIFNEKTALKNSVKGSWVAWAEFDGNVPEDFGSIPSPTLRIQSSNEGHEHCYWRLDRFLGTDELERINRALTYALRADQSGWDAGQILRPPSTFNHKRSREVVLLDCVNAAIPADLFDGLQQPPPAVEAPIPESVPAIEEVIFRYKFTDEVIDLFKYGVPQGKRSSGLMSLGYYLAEMNMTNEEMLSVLLNADKRWGKFEGRSDQLQRLMEIITIARLKYPFKSTQQPSISKKLQPLGLVSLLQTEVNLEWVWEGFLQKGGYMLLTGPSGVGKTQFSLDVGMHMALGKAVLNRPVQPVKIGFFSLEMGLVDIKYFLLRMSKYYTEPGELDTLEKQFQIYPLGEPLYLNKPDARQAVEEAIVFNNLEGIMIDSLGSATDAELGDDKAARLFMGWCDHIRQKYGIFIWIIHHHRKAQSENKRPNKQADVFGSQYYTSYATSIMCLWETGVKGTLDVIPLKVRLSAKPDTMKVKRDNHLHFNALASGVVVVEEEEQEKPEAPTTVVVDSKFGFG